MDSRKLGFSRLAATKPYSKKERNAARSLVPGGVALLISELEEYATL